MVHSPMYVRKGACHVQAARNVIPRLMLHNQVQPRPRAILVFRPRREPICWPYSARRFPVGVPSNGASQRESLFASEKKSHPKEGEI